MIHIAVAIPLNSAHLCLDCQHIGNSFLVCPMCASGHLMPLAPVLNRRHDHTVPRHNDCEHPEGVPSATARLELVNA